MKRYNLIVAVAAAVGWLCAPTLALADHQRNHPRGVSGEEFSVIVPVLDVEPLVRIVQVTTPQEVCWEEPVHHAGYRGRESYTPKILGGIVGGVVGNQFGSGRGKGITTIAGVLLGASIGRDVAYRRAHHGPAHVSMERRCKIEQVTHEEERIDGYEVTYEYGGREFSTHTPVKPGDTIRVRVRVEPVVYNGRIDPGRHSHQAPRYRS
jgi:uncharacterized protein YcfJ